MNSLIQKEMGLMMNVIGNYIDSKQTKIESACSQMLANEKYFEMVIVQIEKIIKAPDFVIDCDLTRIILEIVQLNQKFEFYKALSERKMVIIIYGVIYGALLKCGGSVLANIDAGKLRILYYNSIQLLLICPEKIKFSKECLCGDLWCCWGSSRYRI